MQQVQCKNNWQISTDNDLIGEYIKDIENMSLILNKYNIESSFAENTHDTQHMSK